MRRAALVGLIVPVLTAATLQAASGTVDAAAPSAATAVSTSWTSAGRLTGVAVVSAHNAWAVGDGAHGRTLILHWNGVRWKRMASPKGTLAAVTARSRRTAWAVGATSTGATLTLRWNGARWKRVPSPSPGIDGALQGVAVLSTHDAWAVGSFFDAHASVSRTLILHWNGANWRGVSSPTGSLSGITASSARNAWAVGTRFVPDINAGKTLVLRWNGKTWRRVHSPSPQGNGAALSGAAAISAHRTWAVGCSGCGLGGFANSLIERWTGSSWQKVPSSHPGGGALSAVATVSNRVAWAVGAHYAAVGDSQSLKTLVERWNGSAWSPVSSPSRGAEATLSGLSVRNAHDIWAVGSFDRRAGSGDSTRTLILHWNGSAWK